MMESVEPLVGIAYVPVVQIKVMEKRAPHQFGIRRAEVQAAVQIKAEPGYAEYMFIGGNAPMLDKTLHKLGLLC